RHPDVAYVSPLVQLWGRAPSEDAMLIHAVKIALRNQLRSESIVARLSELSLSGADLAHVAEIALAVPNEPAAWFAFDFVRAHDGPTETLARSLTHAARHVGDERLNEMAGYVQQKFRGDLAQQLPLFQAIYTGLKQKGASLKSDSALGQWGTGLAKAVLDPDSRFVSPWICHPVDPASARPLRNPWGVRNRNCADGENKFLFFDSIVFGEQLTGILRSRPSKIPETFSFWTCGHNGFPDTNPEPVNHVRLKLVESGEIIARQIPPRNDTATKTTWDLKQWAGKQGILEVVDADTGDAFAWLAVSRFEPAVVAPPTPHFTTAA